MNFNKIISADLRYRNAYDPDSSIPDCFAITIHNTIFVASFFYCVVFYIVSHYQYSIYYGLFNFFYGDNLSELDLTGTHFFPIFYSGLYLISLSTAIYTMGLRWYKPEAFVEQAPRIMNSIVFSILIRGLLGLLIVILLYMGAILIINSFPSFFGINSPIFADVLRLIIAPKILAFLGLAIFNYIKNILPA